MADNYHEKCLTCKWLAPDLEPPCGRTFNAVMHVSPHGGIVNISTTPGLIPEQFQKKFENMLAQVFDRVVHVIEAWPGWHELYALQHANPVKQECPGKDESRITDFLRVVK